MPDADVLLRHKLHICDFPPDNGLVCQGRRGFWWDHVSASPTRLSVAPSIILCCGEIFQLVFRSFSKGIFPYVAVDLVCMWEMSSDIPVLPSWTTSQNIFVHIFPSEGKIWVEALSSIHGSLDIFHKSAPQRLLTLYPKLPRNVKGL